MDNADTLIGPSSKVDHLLQENSLLRTLFEFSLRPAIFVTDPDNDFKFVLVNQAACEHFNVTREQIYQWTPLDVDPSFTKETLHDLLADLKKNKTKTFESNHLLPNGKSVPVEIITNLFEFNDKQFIVGYFSNIEERKLEEKRRNEEQIKREHDLLEQQYQKIFDNLYDRVYLLEVADNKILNINNTNISNSKTSTILCNKLCLEDIIPPSKLLLFESQKQLCLSKKESCHYEETIIQADNLSIHLDIVLIPIISSTEEVKRIILVARDITEKKNKEEELARKEQEFRALVELSKDIITRYDINLKRIYANPAFTTLSPIKENDIPSSIEFHNKLTQVFQSGVSQTLDLSRFVHNEERFYEIHFIPEFDLNTKVISVLCIGRDCSAKKHAERALLKREEEFRSLVENSLDNITRHAPDGRRIYINPISARSAAPLAQTLMNTTPEEYPGGESGLLYQQKIQQVAKNKTAAEFELYWTSKNRQKCSLISLVPEQDKDGSVISILAIGRDITELKKISNDLKQSQSQLRDLAAHQERAKENERRQIARELHDELGQQLTALKIETQILEVRYGHLDTTFKEQISRIKDQLKNTISFTRGFVSWLRPAALDLGFTAALEWLVDDIAKLNTSCHFNLELSHEDIDVCEEKAIALFRIAQESLTNIIKHAYASQVNIKLKLQNSFLVMKIKDNGCGFDTKQYNTKSFGLVGIKERSIMIEASLNLTSKIGQGTCIIVRTPLEKKKKQQQN
ncbi:hypothetical protein CYL31_05075 [Marinomonas sp. A3A]|uniref:PAS domain-containing protein n=1 Tax=Marinomonas sp. A3A TaxID=2065312 RepID=UPI001BB367D1|nr:PAS domain-containing protein [Marinomonas sp. A3A]QUX90814.1 hypothetical protein CYL31_05075 [Marinomonas sp. A3A]